MDFLKIALSIYLLALSSMACADNHYTTNFEKETFVIKETHSRSDNGDKVNFCSPFCFCQCCQNIPVFDYSYSFGTISQEVILDIFLHIDNISQEVTHSLLDPPQV